MYYPKKSINKENMKKNLSCMLTCLLLIGTILVASILNVGATGGDGSESTEDVWWPMFAHDLTRSGYSTSTAPETNNVIWNFSTGSQVRSSPAVVDNRLYIALE